METALLAIISICFGTSLFAIVKLVVSGRTKQPAPSDAAKTVEKAQSKADAIIHRAAQSAHKIVVKAELEGVKELAKDKLQSMRIERQFEEELSNIIATILERLETTNQTTIEHQQEMLAKMEKSMVAYLARSQRLLDNKFTILFDQASQHIAETSAVFRKKVETHIDDEIAAAKTEIEQVKNARLKMLDDKFVELIEDAIRVVFEKKLTAGDEVNLIYQSLDEARKEQLLR